MNYSDCFKTLHKIAVGKGSGTVDYGSINYNNIQQSQGQAVQQPQQQQFPGFDLEGFLADCLY